MWYWTSRTTWTTREQGPLGEGVKFGHLIVIKNVIDNTERGYTASDFLMIIWGNNQLPDTFSSFRDMYRCKIGFGSYEVTEGFPNNKFHQFSPPPTIDMRSSSECFGVIHLEETKTCKITNIVVDKNFLLKKLAEYKFLVF